MNQNVNVVSDDPWRDVLRVGRVVDVVVVLVFEVLLVVIELAGQVQKLLRVQVVNDLFGHIHLGVWKITQSF